MHELYAAVAAPADEGGSGSFEVDALLDAVEVTQQIINIANAIQTRAIAHVAAHDEVRDDDVELGWSWRRHGLGFVAEDAPGLVSTRLGVSAPVAARRVDIAVHQVTVTPQLVDAMGAGDLDLWRATVVTRELVPCPDEVAHEIADRLVARFSEPRGWDETAGPMTSRTRRLVARLAPEVADKEAKQASEERSLVRRAVSAAADQWNGVVPVEQSLVMWQAVDSLSRDLCREDPTLTLEQARLDAMAQLILQQADVTIHLHATSPAPDDTTGAWADADRDADARVEDRSSEAAARRGVAELGGLGRPGTTRVDFDALPDGTRVVDSTPLTCDPDTGAIVAGVVPRTLAPCDLKPAAPDDVEGRYRPSPALQRLIRLRDGHCRFPGCQVNARSCDLDHVIAWPAGPTTATNLVCLCRRHHRVKQRPGWTARLDPDGVVHWSDPAGRTTDTHPVDHLDRLHVPAPPTPERTSTAPTCDAREADRLDESSPVSGQPAMSRPEDRPDGRRSDPALIPTLLELSLDRLLELAQADTRRRPAVRVDWVTDAPHGRPVLVDRLPSPPAPGHDDPPF